MKIINKVLRLLVLASVPIVLGASLAFSAQCAAITKKGAQCKRQAAAGSSFCWQHGGKAASNVVQKAPAKEAPKAKDSGDVKASESKSTRCQAITKKGTQCKRQAAAGSSFCWQHGGKVPEAVANNKSVAEVSKSKSPSTVKPTESNSTQCQAITKKGTQCKRKAKPGSRFCWQHGG